MEELERILREHAKCYSKMQLTDAVKLIYQNEFGGWHLIRDEQACLNYLHQEYESVEKDASIPLCEDIGNGIVRVNLAAIKEEDLDGYLAEYEKAGYPVVSHSPEYRECYKPAYRIIRQL